MISYEKAKMGKQLMKQFIAEGGTGKSSVNRVDVPDADSDRGCDKAAEK